MAKLNSKVLIIDDSHVARRMLIAQLREIGFAFFVEAEDGDQGLQKLVDARASKSPFALIITDLRMPNLSGEAFLRKICADPDFKNIPKLITSVETDRGTVLNAVLTGANGYILKPTTTPVLKEKLEKILNGSKAA